MEPLDNVSSENTERAPEPEPQANGNARARYLNWKIGLVVALVAMGVWLLRPSHATAKGRAAYADKPAVAAVRATREDIAREQVFDAEFRPYEETELHAKVAGFVNSLLVDVGDRVTNGQLLATLEVPELNDDLERAEAVARRSEHELTKAQAEYEQAHVAFSRLAAVDKAQPNLVAQQDIDLAQAKDRAAEAALETARQQIAVARAEAKKLRTMMGYSRITAPFDGVITKRFTAPGALIHGGGASSGPLLRVSENNRLRLVFPVSVSFVPLIKVGDAVAIRVQPLNKNLTGRISRFTREIEMATRTMDVEAEVPNEDLSLVPGMYASVSLKLERRDHTVVVPVEAVSRQKISTVFVISPDNQIEERAVQLGLETPAKLEVLAGVSEKELVMIGSRTQVKPGQKVEPRLIEIKHIE